MINRDLIGFTLNSALSHKLRSALTAVGIGIGVAAVVLLTSIGEGLQNYVLAEFSQFGTNIIIVTPGRPETFGLGNLPLASVKPLTIDDVEALKRVPDVINVAGVVQGNAEIEANGRSRRTLVNGSSPSMPEVWSFDVALGEYLPADDQSAPRPLVVLGSKVRDELFDTANPLGEKVRVGGRRYRVVGVMESKGTVLGFDMDDAIYVPVLRGLEMFNREGLAEVDVLYEKSVPSAEIEAGIRRVLIARHGAEDFTLTAQEEMIDVLGSVLDVVTFAIAGLGAISLLVGGVGIFTIMTIAVRERTAEIGLLRALGAGRANIRMLFLVESILLAALGGLGGLLLGMGIVEGTKLFVPALPLSYSIPYAVLAEVMAVLIGAVAGVLPARQAAGMDPIEALRAE